MQPQKCAKHKRAQETDPVPRNIPLSHLSAHTEVHVHAQILRSTEENYTNSHLNKETNGSPS